MFACNLIYIFFIYVKQTVIVLFKCGNVRAIKSITEGFPHALIHNAKQ